MGGELARPAARIYDEVMSTVAEIESAIEKLPPPDLEKLLAWLDDYRAMVGASEDLFAMYDGEEADAEGKARRSVAC
jgi:hypothetical protein